MTALFLIMAPLVPLPAQARLTRHALPVEVMDGWINVSEPGYEILYRKQVLAVPPGSGVYLDEEGFVHVVHLPVVRGDGGVRLRAGDAEYPVNGIGFYKDGAVRRLWLNREHPVSLAGVAWTADLLICAADPFGPASVTFHPDGSVRMLSLAGAAPFSWGGREYVIQGQIVFHPSGRTASVRFREPLDFPTPLGPVFAATAGFYDDGALRYVTIKAYRLNTSLGTLELSRSIDFHPDGRVFVSFLTSPLPAGGKTYQNAWIGFDPQGGFIGEMEYDGDAETWRPKP